MQVPYWKLSSLENVASIVGTEHLKILSLDTLLSKVVEAYKVLSQFCFEPSETAC